MKKIDLHIHTVPSLSDSHFTFDLESLKLYVNRLEIDCIAITNHNLFDKSQFETIQQNLSIKVFPGIEIDLEGGHILLISENTNLNDFEQKCKKVQALITCKTDFITYEQLIHIFPTLSDYLLIPHYDKKPNISELTLAKLGKNIFAGEVTSLRKFKTCINERDKLTPVIFSDCRFVPEMLSFPTRQTFIDAGETTLNAIKGCLGDKHKVFLYKEDGNNLFQATDDGVILSTGLNVIIGERSSGKTHTLEKICENFENVKYIKQFSLLQDDAERFKNFVTTKHSLVTDSYLKEFELVVLEVNDIDLRDNDLKLEKYLISLKKFASESDRLDNYSKCRLYSETLFELDNLLTLKKIIEATQVLLDNIEYKLIIEKHVLITSLKNLFLELVEQHNKIYESNQKKIWLNSLITDIKDSLKFKSTNTSVEEIDFYKFQLEREKVRRFELVVKNIQSDKEIDRKEVRGFKVIARTKKFTGAGQLKSKSKSTLIFSQAFLKFDKPYDFLQSLKTIGIPEAEFYKYFVDIQYNILNKYGFPVSGGERSEFNLLNEINDALKHDLLLIDEPKSSFDNIFLKNEVNELIKDISKEIPVIIVTHNNTIGASIQPDFIVYTQKKIEQDNVSYFVYFGHPTNKKLQNLNGEMIDNYEIMLKCLEAGKDAYNERKTKIYEILEN